MCLCLFIPVGVGEGKGRREDKKGKSVEEEKEKDRGRETVLASERVLARRVHLGYSQRPAEKNPSRQSIPLSSESVPISQVSNHKFSVLGTTMQPQDVSHAK